FIPVRLRSSRKTFLCGVSDKSRIWLLGLLRSPTGINPLATGTCQHTICVLTDQLLIARMLA
ncbi:hypothetical protein, partial [Pseudomonas sp. GM80]|uniref:hypothetical protein n=1 Tax=Pseudomonas sp. GM80 TaxID=1144339 RepID=UPI001EE64435